MPRPEVSYFWEAPKYQDPRKGLNKLEGLKGLSQQKQKDFRNLAINSKLVSDKAADWEFERLYSDINYINKFGQEDFLANTDYKERDKKYRDSIISDVANEFFGAESDNVKNTISQLSSDSLLELLNSGYKNKAELKKYKNEIEKQVEDYEKLVKYKPLNPNLPDAYDARESVVETIKNKYKDAEERNTVLLNDIFQKDRINIRSDFDEDAKTIQRGLETGIQKWQEYDEKIKNLYASDNIQEKDINNIIEEAKKDNIISDDLVKTLYKLNPADRLNQLSINLQNSTYNINNILDELDRLATVSEDNPYGSTYYTAFKDSRKLQNVYDEATKELKSGKFTTSDKLYEYAMFMAVANKRGLFDAFTQLDAGMAQRVKDNEDFMDHFSDVMINIGYGGLANIMNKINGVVALGIAIGNQNNPEALQNFLSGKTVDGRDKRQGNNRNDLENQNDESTELFYPFPPADVLKDKIQKTWGAASEWLSDNIFNPQYWSRVDEYNTLDPMEIARIESLGGISPYTAVNLPNEKIDFFSRRTLDEALKMTKFLWSDALTAQLMGGATERISSGITKGSFNIGRQFLPEFSAGRAAVKIGKAAEKIGALATVAASAVGISESYGMMTYNQVYDEIMGKAKEEFNASRDSYIEERLSSKEIQEAINKEVNKRLNAQRINTVYNENTPQFSKEYFEEQVTNEIVEKLYNEWETNNKGAISQKEAEAKRAATNAYMVDATIEEARMSAINFFFKKYLFSDSTKRALGESRYSSDIYEKAPKEYAVKKGLMPYFKNIGGRVLSGFESNYFDDVTVGFAKGFGLSQYNSYLERKYSGDSAAKSAELSYSFIDGLGGAFSSAQEALFDRQSFYDGFVGGFGSILSGMPRIGKQMREQSRQQMNKKAGDKLSFLEKVNLNFQNPLLDAYFETKGKIERTEAILPALNKIIEDNQEAFQDISTVLNSLEGVLTAYGNKDVKDIKDNKNNSAFQLMYSLLGKEYRSVMSDFAPAHDFLNEIKEAAKGNITDETVASFLARPENTELSKLDNAKDIARDRIQRNAKSLQKMGEIIKEASEILDNAGIGEVDPDEKEQLVYMLSMEDAWRTRLNSMEKEISGKTLFSEADNLKERIASFLKRDTPKTNPVAKYGSLKELIRQRDALISEIAASTFEAKLIEKAFKEAEKRMREANKTYNEEDPNDVFKNDYLLKHIELNKISQELEERKKELRELKKQEKTFKDEENIPLLTKEDILNLNPIDREHILNKNNASNYSKEQREIIESAREVLTQTVGNDYWRTVVDSNRLYQQLIDNRKAYYRLYTNPEAALAYVRNIQLNRGKQAKLALEYRALDNLYSEFDSIRTKEGNESFIERVRKELITKGSPLNTDYLKAYINERPETKEVLDDLFKLSQLRDAISSSVDALYKDNEAARQIKTYLASTVMNASTVEEAMEALEGELDAQTNNDAKRAINTILDGVKQYGFQRDATKLRDREKENNKKAKEQAEKEEKEKAKDGKNFGFNGFKVGDSVYNTDGKFEGTVTEFVADKSDETTVKPAYMIIKSKAKDGTTSKRYVYKEDASKFTTKKPENIKEAKEQKTETKEEKKPELKPQKPVEVKVEKPQEETPIDSDGAVESPSAKEQAVNDGNEYKEFDASDLTRKEKEETQIAPTSLPGNRYQQYSYSKLKQGIVEEEEPENKNSMFGQFVGWLRNNKIHLQDIIDKEFAKIILAKPDTKIRFMMFNTQKPGIINSGSIESLLVNVIEFTPEVAKYHNDENGGVITDAEGKQWLVVGTTGFSKDATPGQRSAYNAMRLPISNRRLEYFKTHPNAQYYVDEKAYSTVSTFTSGNIVKQGINSTEVKKRSIKEVMEASGKALKDAEFGIQTRQINDKRGFVFSKNVKKTDNIYPPTDTEANMGRTFLLIDTPNGNKIPAYIDAEMFNNLHEGSPLKDLIMSTLFRLFDTNFEARHKAVSELCGLLVLSKKGKNILVGNKDSNTLTIVVPQPSGYEKKVTFNLNAFSTEDRLKFLNEFAQANFEVNITTTVTNTPYLLEMYNESGALMTDVESTETVGSTYTIYPVSAEGTPIKVEIEGNRWTETGKSDLRAQEEKKTLIGVNNKYYTIKGNKFVSPTGEVVTKQSDSKLWWSLKLKKLMTEAENPWPVVATKGLNSVYTFILEGKEVYFEKDNLDNVTFLTDIEIEDIQRQLNNEVKEKAIKAELQELDLGNKEKTVEEQAKKSLDEILPFDISNAEKAKPEIKEQTKTEVTEDKSKTVTPITNISKGSTERLENSGKDTIFTLEEAMSDMENPTSLMLLEALENKGLDNLTAAELKETLSLPSTVSDVKELIDIINNCR